MPTNWLPFFCRQGLVYPFTARVRLVEPILYVVILKRAGSLSVGALSDYT